MRKLKRGQYYTAHDGSEIWRHIESVQPDRPLYDCRLVDGKPQTVIVGRVSLIYYWTNRGRDLHRCHRHTFVDWIRNRKARKTQKNRTRQL
jgi:hypothetical protein